MSYPALFRSLRLGRMELPNRVLMAPLTRMRAGTGNVPSELSATYYAQRASAGLIISEGTAVSEQGQGYPSAPESTPPNKLPGGKQLRRRFMPPADASSADCP